MKNCTETTLLELFKKHASTPQEAQRVYALVKGTELDVWEIGELLGLKGMGRKGALLVMEVACDLWGKK